jgi:hypothetical protein
MNNYTSSHIICIEMVVIGGLLFKNMSLVWLWESFLQYLPFS